MSSTKSIKTVETSIDFNNLPPVTPIKTPQHVICMELAKKGYRAKQVSEISGIKLTNVSWYFSKYKLNEIAMEVLMKDQPKEVKVSPTKVDEVSPTKVEKKVVEKKEVEKKVVDKEDKKSQKK